MVDYRRNLPHIEKWGYPHYLTFNTFQDLYLPPRARDLVFNHCLYEHNRRVHMHAFVVMPTHVHTVFTPLEDERGERYHIATITNSIKGASAHSVNRLLKRKGHMWQDESFDHVVRKFERLEMHIEYIRQNPVEAGIVKRPEDYKWLWIEPQFRKKFEK